MIKRLALLVVFIIAAFIGNAFMNPIPRRIYDKSFRPNYGVSFSFEQSGWYGVPPREGFSKLITDYKFNWVRLPFFWDQMVDEDGNLKIDDLVWAIEEAKKRNVRIVVALGAKTPYYPEYHLPKYVESKLKFGEVIDVNSPVAGDILEIDRKVVEALSHFDNIIAWQVENEPLLRNINDLQIDPSLVRQEVGVVRAIDAKKRPIILNTSSSGLVTKSADQLLKILKPGDIFGVNAYFKTQGVYLVNVNLFDNQVKINWPVGFYWSVQSWLFFSPDYQSAKKIADERGLQLWVLEMQAEPYIRVIEDADKNEYAFRPSDIGKATDFLRSYKVDSIGFWGASFWQRRENIGDAKWSDSVKKIINN